MNVNGVLIHMRRRIFLAAAALFLQSCVEGATLEELERAHNQGTSSSFGNGEGSAGRFDAGAYLEGSLAKTKGKIKQPQSQPVASVDVPTMDAGVIDEPASDAGMTDETSFEVLAEEEPAVDAGATEEPRAEPPPSQPPVVSLPASIPPSASGSFMLAPAGETSIAKVSEVTLSFKLAHVPALSEATVEVFSPAGVPYQVRQVTSVAPVEQEWELQTRLPVAGTVIQTSRMTGRWRAQLSVDSQILSVQTFDLTP